MKHETEPIISFGKAYVATPTISFGRAVKNFYGNYFDFSSRARRSEYWWAVLYVFIAEIILAFSLTFLDSFNSGVNDLFSIISYIADLFLFTIPMLSLTFRRLHDVDKSGWYLLLGLIPLIGAIILFIWEIKNSTVGPNNWGLSPKYFETEMPDGEA